MISALFLTYPVAAPIISSGILTFCGDVIAQQAVERKGHKGHDWHRTIRLTSWGLCLSGPFSCLWYRFLDHYVVTTDIVTTTLLRMSLDQFFIAPLFLSLFFAYNSALEQPKGQRMIAWKGKMRASYWEVLKANWKVWPAVQCLNFSIVPLQYRLVFVNVVALGWNAYLSVKTCSHKPIIHVPMPPTIKEVV